MALINYVYSPTALVLFIVVTIMACFQLYVLLVTTMEFLFVTTLVEKVWKFPYSNNFFNLKILINSYTEKSRLVNIDLYPSRRARHLIYLAWKRR
jgi:hypothetical protein